MRTAGSPRRARTVRAVPAYWSSRPVPRSRRERYQGAGDVASQGLVYEVECELELGVVIAPAGAPP
jgi:hypothetical protein